MRQPLALGWHQIYGRELSAAESLHAVEALLPSDPAVYVWMRDITPPASIRHSAVKMERWVLAVSEAPLSVEGPLDISHYARILSMEFGGGSLPSLKKDTLSKLCSQPKGRLLLTAVLQELTNMAPALYVGETDSLARRVWEHISGATDFSHRLEEIPDWEWGRLSLRYICLPKPPSVTDTDMPKQVRTLLETIVSRVSLGVSVKRVG